MKSRQTGPYLLACGWKRRLQAQMPRRRPARAARRGPRQSQPSLVVRASLPLMMALVESLSRKTPDISLLGGCNQMEESTHCPGCQQHRYQESAGPIIVGVIPHTLNSLSRQGGCCWGAASDQGCRGPQTAASSHCEEGQRGEREKCAQICRRQLDEKRHSCLEGAAGVQGPAEGG